MKTPYIPLSAGERGPHRAPAPGDGEQPLHERHRLPHSATAPQTRTGMDRDRRARRSSRERWNLRRIWDINPEGAAPRRRGFALPVPSPLMAATGRPAQTGVCPRHGHARRSPHRPPRADGGLPHPHRVGGGVAAAAPRRRGFAWITSTMTYRKRGRPAQTGVCRLPQHPGVEVEGPPRADGGLPLNDPVERGLMAAAPRRRGFAGGFPRTRGDRPGRPAQTGVCREKLRLSGSSFGPPRADGGLPTESAAELYEIAAAPRRRGFAVQRDVDLLLRKGRPAQTGIWSSKRHIFVDTLEFPKPWGKKEDSGKQPRKPTSDDSTKKASSDSTESCHHTKTPRTPEEEAAAREKKKQARRDYERTRNELPEVKERRRDYLRERNRKRKEEGLCRHCGEAAIEGQARCTSCAEKHRASSRADYTERSAATEQAAEKREATQTPERRQNTQPANGNLKDRIASTREQPNQGDRPERTSISPERREYDKARSRSPERREYNRHLAQEQRQKARETGQCRNCSRPAIPGQTRCPACAEAHRQSRRISDARRRAAAKQAGNGV